MSVSGYMERRAGLCNLVERLAIPGLRLALKTTMILLLSTSPLCAQSTSLADPRGPVAAYARQVQVDDEGAQIPGFVQPSSRQSGLWNPTWISVSSPVPQKSRAIQFRREFTLDGPVASATAWISADPHYQFWVNGVLSSRGPDDPGSDYEPHNRWSHRWLAG
jgi:hypothetical protein